MKNLCVIVLLVLAICAAADQHLRPKELNGMQADGFVMIQRHVESSHTALLSQADKDLFETVQSPTTTTTNQNWFSRMKDSFYQFLIGLVLITFSIPVLWFNESRSAQMESLIAYASSHCRAVDAKTADQDNRYALVHLSGESTKALGHVKDDDFNLDLNGGVIKLARHVEVYQWVEHESSQETEKLGGGKETVTTYSYEQEWAACWKESSSFQNSAYRGVNKKPNGLELGAHLSVADAVEYGTAFELSQSLIEQLVDFQSASEKIGSTVTFKAGFLSSGNSFKKHSDDYYYHSSSGSSKPESPEVGDARVNFTYVADGPASILALQAPGKTKESFLPYRLINRGWCGISEEEEKRLLKEQGEKSGSELSEEAGCGGCLGCLCCACNIVARCCSGMLTPQINDIITGCHTQGECFNIVTRRATVFTWLIRLGGWLMMFIGLYSLFSPFLMLIRVLPFIGPFLSSFGGALIWFLCLLTTLLIASALIIVAYLFFHPMKALLYSVGVGLLVGGIVLLSHHFAAAA